MKIVPLRNPILLEKNKEEISAFWMPLIQQYKEKIKAIEPDKNYNYLVDIYSKWYCHYFYFCALYQAEYPDRIKDNFEEKYLRFEYISRDKCNLAYFRHTGQWHVVAESISFEECAKMIAENPNFQPIF